MATKPTDVEKIKEFLRKKIENLKSKLKEFEGPLTAELARTSTHMQLEFISLKSELKANEENLLAIETFCPVVPDAPAEPKPEESGGKQ